MCIEIVTIDEEIKITGLSYKKLGLPETIESLEKMWDMYTEKYRHKINNAIAPLVEYGVNDCLLTDNHEYIAGCAVTKLDELDENWTSFIVPPGKYVKHTSRNPEELHSTDINAWAKVNGIKLDGNFMLEVYPNGVKNDVGVYTLRPIHADMGLLKRAEEILNKSTVHGGGKIGHSTDWVMALTDENGYPNASMITASKADGFKWIAFCIDLRWNKPKRAAKDPRSCIYFFDEDSFTGISLTGKIEVATDLDVKKQMWWSDLEEHFKSPENDTWCVLMFKPEQYNIYIDDRTIRGNF